MKKYLVVFGFTGFLVPLFFEFVWHFIKEDFGSWFIVIFWPSFIFLAEHSRSASVKFIILALSVAANIAFYSAIGFFFWGLFHKSRWFLAVFLVPILWFCYRVFVLVHS